MKQIVQCVPNFSEGRDTQRIEMIIAPFRGKTGVQLLDYSADADHNRLVVTVIGEPDPLGQAVIEAIGVASRLIDMTEHRGQHPRMGATDVVPFIPIKNVTMEACVELSKKVAEAVYTRYNVPSFLYEKSASAPHRENLAAIRKGQFEGMAEKICDPKWQPDYGEALHPTAGITAIGARMPLVAFNVNLATDKLEIADKIARSVRHINGGLRYCKALGIALEERGIVQVSMNLTDYTKTPIYRVVELIKIEAKRYGVSVIGSEIVGLVPMDALVQTAAYYLGLENFEDTQVLERRMLEQP